MTERDFVSPLEEIFDPELRGTADFWFPSIFSSSYKKYMAWKLAKM